MLPSTTQTDYSCTFQHYNYYYFFLIDGPSIRHFCCPVFPQDLDGVSLISFCALLFFFFFSPFLSL